MQKVTIKDVAKLAKVSPSTVSRVLSGSPSISDDTCKRVKNAVKELHYTPNTTARSLRCEKKQKYRRCIPRHFRRILRNVCVSDTQIRSYV